MNIVGDLKCNVHMFADDTTLYVKYEDAVIAADSLNCDLTSVSKWAPQWLVKFPPPEKTSSMVCTHKDRAIEPTLYMYFDGVELHSLTSHRHFGVVLSSDLRWHRHIQDMLSLANRQLDSLCWLCCHISLIEIHCNSSSNSLLRCSV